MTEKINIGLTDTAVDTSVQALLTYLADSNVLYVKTQGFHWNVISSDFAPLHELMQKQYEDLAESIDETAERVRMLGRMPVASLTAYAETSQLSEVKETSMSDVAMLQMLLDDHESLCRYLREQIPVVQKGGDEVTADYFIERLAVHEKAAWFLRSTIAGRA